LFPYTTLFRSPASLCSSVTGSVGPGVSVISDRSPGVSVMVSVIASLTFQRAQLTVGNPQWPIMVGIACTHSASISLDIPRIARPQTPPAREMRYRSRGAVYRPESELGSKHDRRHPPNGRLRPGEGRGTARY